jgi:hypothetical protein
MGFQPSKSYTNTLSSIHESQSMLVIPQSPFTTRNLQIKPHLIIMPVILLIYSAPDPNRVAQPLTYYNNHNCQFRDAEGNGYAA